MTQDERLEAVIAAVLSGARYAHIHPGLVSRIAAQELAKGRSHKEAVKETRNKLHQVGGAYQATGPDYTRLSAALDPLPGDLEAMKPFCQKAMQAHASTRERLPYLEAFFAPLCQRLGPVGSILDLACGLNPLALAWMPLAPGGEYYACDIYSDMLDFLNRFFAHAGVNGKAGLCDLAEEVPVQPVKLALLLKTLPCLEQLDRAIGPRLLEGLQAEFILVSFPSRSLGGRGKGMPQTYTAHFEQLLAGRSWQVERWSVQSELAFLIRKG